MRTGTITPSVHCDFAEAASSRIKWADPGIVVGIKRNTFNYIYLGYYVVI